MAEWVKVADLDHLGPGEGFETDLEVNGETVGLFCVDGEYYALGECTHERGPLCQGIIEADRVTCPWHSARFHITTGKCIEGPTACRVEGNIHEGEDEAAGLLPECNRYQVKVEGNEIFVLVDE